MADQIVTDVLIAGGGPVGAMLALGLRGCGASVLHVRSDAGAGERPIALSYGSRLLLEREGAWPAASPTPISEIHVSQQGGFGRTRDGFKVSWDGSGAAGRKGKGPRIRTNQTPF